MDVFAWMLRQDGVVGLLLFVLELVLFVTFLFGGSALWAGIRGPDHPKAEEHAFVTLMLSVAFGPVVVGLIVVGIEALA